jgi:putative addiction module antidote protein, CC2985 family
MLVEASADWRPPPQRHHPTASRRPLLTRFVIACQLFDEEDPSMATMNVSLPDAMKDWVEAQARTGRYSNASDYVRDLIRRDQERAGALAELQTLITEGLASGISERTIDEVVDLARQKAQSVSQR